MSTSEIFDASTVKGTISDINGEFNELSSIIESINSKVSDALSSSDRAMYGDAASKVLGTWEENCSTLNEFINIFDAWSSMVVSIGNEYGNLQEGTAKVENADLQAFETLSTASIATLSNNTNKEDIKKAKQQLKGSIKTKHEEAEKIAEERRKAKEEAKNAVESSDFAISPHAHASKEDRARRLQIVGGECGSEAEQDSKMTTIEVPYWDGTSIKQWKITVNKNLTQNYINAFTEIANMKTFIINPGDGAGAYNYYHTPRPSGAPSDHTLGSAIDINVPNNWYSGDGSDMSVRMHEEVIAAFAKQGFYWGGDWRTSKDDMHFSFTGY